MKEAAIINNFRKQANAIEGIRKQQGQSMQYTMGFLQKLQRDVQTVTIYLNVLEQYTSKFWWLPRAFFPGSKIFDKMYANKIEEINARQKAQMEKQQEQMRKQQEEAAKKAAEEDKKGGNAKTSEKEPSRIIKP